MSNFNEKIWEETLLPFEVIEAVISGDASVGQKVLDAFEAYIDKVCLISVTDENGMTKSKIDADMKHELQQNLLLAITNNFKMLPLE